MSSAAAPDRSGGQSCPGTTPGREESSMRDDLRQITVRTFAGSVPEPARSRRGSL
jgi:hypothetical protein